MVEEYQYLNKPNISKHFKTHKKLNIGNHVLCKSQNNPVTFITKTRKKRQRDRKKNTIYFVGGNINITYPANRAKETEEIQTDITFY